MKNTNELDWRCRFYEVTPFPLFSTLVIWCAIAGICAFILYRIIWVIGWRLGVAKRWFSQPHCPHCNSLLNSQTTLLQNCPKCYRPVASWASLPMPIPFPTPVAFIPVMDAPPPL